MADDIKSMLNWVHHSAVPSLSLLAKSLKKKIIDFWKILQNEANFRELLQRDDQNPVAAEARERSLKIC